MRAWAHKLAGLTVAKGDYRRLRCQHLPPFAAIGHPQQLFPQGLPGRMADRPDWHLILSDRLRASDARWLRRAWAGPVRRVSAGLRARCARRRPLPRGGGDDDPRTVAADALGSVENNRDRRDGPGSRRLGLPIRRAVVESRIEPRNRRREGTKPFRKDG
jgi:hypothetical protein